MKNNVSFTLLFDFYGDLLPEKQRAYVDAYYNQDLSLAEIAENEGVSRQGVHDALSRAEAALTAYEEKLECAAKSLRRRQAAKELRLAAEHADNALKAAVDAACRALED